MDVDPWLIIEYHDHTDEETEDEPAPPNHIAVQVLVDDERQVRELIAVTESVVHRLRVMHGIHDDLSVTQDVMMPQLPDIVAPAKQAKQWGDVMRILSDIPKEDMPQLQQEIYAAIKRAKDGR